MRLPSSIPLVDGYKILLTDLNRTIETIKDKMPIGSKKHADVFKEFIQKVEAVQDRVEMLSSTITLQEYEQNNREAHGFS